MTIDTVRLHDVESSASLPDVWPLPFQRDKFLTRCLGNVEFAERILRKFQRIFEDDYEGLQQALRLQDAAAVARVAHRLKGSAGNVAADRLFEVLCKIEQSGRLGYLAECPELLDQLQSEWQLFCECAGLTNDPGKENGHTASAQ